MTEQIYFGGFSNWEDVVSNFRISIFPEPDQVIYAEYDNGGWDGSAFVVYRNKEKYYTVEGSHCSCYGLEDQWEPEEYETKELFLGAIDRILGSGYGDGVVWSLIKERVK